MNNGKLEKEQSAVTNVDTMLHQETIAKEVESLNKKLNNESKRKGICKVLPNVSRSS